MIRLVIFGCIGFLTPWVITGELFKRYGKSLKTFLIGIVVSLHAIVLVVVLIEIVSFLIISILR